MDSLSSLVPLITGGAAASGTVGNIITDEKKAAYQNYIMSLLKNPGALAAMVSKLQAPLNNGLTQSVGNQVQGNLAERGLSQAPGVFAASESQALAPFYQQNQNAAMQSVLQLLGMPAGTFGSPVNTTGAWSAFQNSLKKPAASSGSGNWWDNVTFPTDSNAGAISTDPLFAGQDNIGTNG